VVRAFRGFFKLLCREYFLFLWAFDLRAWAKTADHVRAPLPSHLFLRRLRAPVIRSLVGASLSPSLFYVRAGGL